MIIRQVNMSDAAFLKDLVNTDGWLKYIGDRNVKTDEQATKYTESYVTSYEKDGFGFYLMEEKETKKRLGITGFIKREELPHIDIGFAIMPQFAKQGYTYEASVAVLKYGFEELKLKIVLAITTEDNVASQNLLKKLGLEFHEKIKFKKEDLLAFKIEKQ